MPKYKALMIRFSFLKNIISVCLVAVLMTPSLSQLLHSFEGHSHYKPCTENERHFHEKTDLCLLCDFCVSDNYDDFHHDSLFLTLSISTKTDVYHPPFILNKYLVSNLLRGPPQSSLT